MYSGQIKSRGPRYCPSVEDKIVRFGDKDSHQILLRIYRSTDQQDKLVEQARIVEQFTEEEQVIDLAEGPVRPVERDAAHDRGQIGRLSRAESEDGQGSIGLPRDGRRR